MPNTYAWVIEQLDCYPQKDGRQDVVFTVFWHRQATNNAGHLGDVYGSQEITLNPMAPFTPYADLTFAQICGWLVDAMGADRVAELDAALDRQIAAQINPPVVTPPLPWA